MHIIPVIDVKGGLAVGARGGDRANYRPLSTPMAPTGDPLEVARGYLALFPFPTLYIADLDGIGGRGADLTLVRRLAGMLPDVDLWVDNGAIDEAGVALLLAIPGVAAVAGSEGGITPDAFDRLSRAHPGRIVLSLDFKGEDFLGAPEFLATPLVWPNRVIAMTLARVGSAAGPDLARIRSIAAAAGATRRVYAAGGIRDRADLDAARQAGAAGALVATALHSGAIGAVDLAKLS